MKMTQLLGVTSRCADSAAGLCQRVPAHLYAPSYRSRELLIGLQQRISSIL